MHLEQTPKTWNFSCKVLLHCFLSVVFWVLSILASSHPLDGSLANASAQRLSDVQSDPNPTVLRMKVDWFSELYKHHKTCINTFHWLTSLIVYTHLIVYIIVYHIHVFQVTSSYRTVSCKLSLPVLAWCENLRNWRQWCPSSHRLQWALPEEVFMQKFHASQRRVGTRIDMMFLYDIITYINESITFYKLRNGSKWWQSMTDQALEECSG